MKVHEIMTAHARCVGPENTLVEAAGLMREMDVGALPVCEEERVIGIVTDRDLAVRAIAAGRDPSTTIVRDVMTPGVVHVFADQEVEEAARTMQQNEVRRLPVLSRDRRLVGILSLGDVAVSSNPAFSGMTLREVSQPAQPNGRERKRDAMGRAAGAGPRPEMTAASQRDTLQAEPEPSTRRSPKRSSTKKSPRESATGRTSRQQRQRKSASAPARKTGGRSKASRSTSPQRRKSATRAGR